MPPIPAPKPILNKSQTNGLTNGINVGEFIKGRIRDIDDDPSQPPYDSLQEYAYEGEPLARNEECTLSTLTITSKDQNDIDKELELEYLKKIWDLNFNILLNFMQAMERKNLKKRITKFLLY